jgi:serine/threonine protein kinase
MYCPKCKDTFEEGSRRFCPTDGSRLIPEGGTAGRPAGGIFANLIPKIQAVSATDETLIGRKSPVLRQSPPPVPQPSRPPEAEDVPFFELDDLDLNDTPAFKRPDAPAKHLIEPASEADTRPIARKVQPFEIPAGHVDLHAENRFPSPAEDFSLDNPERFIGRTVKGRYLVLEFLGGDETGLAYLGDDKIVDGRKVLVRILIEDDYDPIMSSILAEERVSLSHFSHPNVARTIDSGEFSNGMAFLVSEYVDALSVNDILTIHGRFNPQRAGRIIRQAASGLNEAHQEGIIHRDIRPENLVVDASGDSEQVMVVNFGASNGEPNPQNLPYKAPEVLEGKIATVASDIYSLAVVGYEMLTGVSPFDGEDDRAFLRAQRNGLTYLPSSLNREISTSVDEVFERALAYEVSDRFPKARDFGDALVAALADPVKLAVPLPVEKPTEPVMHPVADTEMPTQIRKGPVISLEPAVAAVPTPPAPAAGNEEPNWRNRSPEPPVEYSSRQSMFAVGGILALLLVVAAVWYFAGVGRPTVETGNQADNSAPPAANVANTDMPPLPRTISQPPNTTFYQNTKANLKGDLLRNFVGFSLFYPQSWKVNGPQSGSTPNVRGKFLDISRLGEDGRMMEQMLVSYYPSKGTFDLDGEKFPQMVKETNETLKKLLPGYQMISEGEIKLNQNWRAYEIKFQAGGKSESGEDMVVWGRRIFVPAARPGTRNGFEITMLATSLAAGLSSVDDVGVKGDLAQVLETFEPSQNF